MNSQMQPKVESVSVFCQSSSQLIVFSAALITLCSFFFSYQQLCSQLTTHQGSTLGCSGVLGYQRYLLQYIFSWVLEVQSLLGLPCHCCSVSWPGEVIRDVTPPGILKWGPYAHSYRLCGEGQGQLSFSWNWWTPPSFFQCWKTSCF